MHNKRHIKRLNVEIKILIHKKKNKLILKGYTYTKKITD